MWLLFDKFLPQFLHCIVMKCSKWKPRLARNQPDKVISGERHMLDLLRVSNFMFVILLLGFAVPIISSLATRMTETPVLSAVSCAYMAPSLSVRNYTSQSHFLNSQKWTYEMFATVNFQGFAPSNDYFKSEFSSAGQSVPAPQPCIISTPFVIKIEPKTEKIADYMSMGEFYIFSQNPMVFNMTAISSQSNITCVGYNDATVGVPFISSERGLADYITIFVFYSICVSVLILNWRGMTHLAISLQNQSILIDTRITWVKYFQTYRWLAVAVAYFTCMLVFTSVWEVRSMFNHESAPEKD
jgi:hypothetical protein